jgi:hypothetical protein
VGTPSSWRRGGRAANTLTSTCWCCGGTGSRCSLHGILSPGKIGACREDGEAGPCHQNEGAGQRIPGTGPGNGMTGCGICPEGKYKYVFTVSVREAKSLG